MSFKQSLPSYKRRVSRESKLIFDKLVKNIEIGGRNLLPNSEKIVVNKGLERINLTTHIKKGSDLIISGNYRVLEGNPQELSIRIRDIDGNHVDAGIRNIAVNDTRSEERRVGHEHR